MGARQVIDFNLIDEPWVPVVEQCGKLREVSLREALNRAHEIASLQTANPLEAVALLRQVLLPVVWDACGLPASLREWSALWQAKRLDAKAIDAYLSAWRDRFWVFHPVSPFAQAAGLEEAGSAGSGKSVGVLMPEVASGNNVPLFSPFTDRNPPSLDPASAIRAVLVCHCWDTAGIKPAAKGDPAGRGGKTYGNPTGPVGGLGVIVPLGTTLFETIVLNTPAGAAAVTGDDDRPQWRRDPLTPAWEERPARGLLDLLTWQARRIRLLPPEHASGGAAAVTVSEAVVTAGDRLTFTPEFEPHTAWENVEPSGSGQPPRRPRRHYRGLTSMRGLMALLALTQSQASGDDRVEPSNLVRQLGELAARRLIDLTYPVRACCVSLSYGNQKAVVEDVVADVLPLPLAALIESEVARGEVTALAQEVEHVRSALTELHRDVLKSSGWHGTSAPAVGPRTTGEMFVHAVDGATKRFLRSVQADPSVAVQAHEQWRDECRRVASGLAKRLLDSASPTALRGRQGTGATRPICLATAQRRFRSSLRRTLGFGAGAEARQVGEPHTR